MGIKTYIVELIMGDQAADKKPLASPGALRGQLIEETVPAPLELLQALAEVGGMHRDWIHSQSANGTLRYKITSIVTYVPEVHLNRVALGRQSIHVRVKNAISVLGPVFAKHPHIDCSALTDWVIQKKQPLAPVADDGFEDARIASPNSPLNAEFAFKGHFLSEEEGDRRQRNPGPGVHARDIDKEASMTTLTYRLLGDAGTEIQAGVLSAFPATIGRDDSLIAVPKSHTLVSGPHIELSTDAAGNVFVKDIGSSNQGSTNGTWLENGAQVTQLIKATRLPASGRLILGADKPIARAAVLEFSIKSPRLEQARRGPGGHDPTIPTEVLPEGRPVVCGGVPPSRVAETKITTLNQGGKFGILALKYSNGDVQTVPINTLPFTIGRDPELKVGEGAAVRAACEKVSGRHIRIEDTGSDGFHVRNLALNRNGSFLDSIIPTDGFFWSFSKPTEPAGGWLKLGGDTLDDETVWGRVYAPLAK